MISDKSEFCKVKSRRNPSPEPHFLFQKCTKTHLQRNGISTFIRRRIPDQGEEGRREDGPELALSYPPPSPNYPKTATTRFSQLETRDLPLNTRLNGRSVVPLHRAISKQWWLCQSVS